MLKLGNINVRKFKLSEQFISKFKEEKVPWGPVGYVTFKRTYARRLNEFEEGAVGTEELIFKRDMLFQLELNGTMRKLKEQQKKHTRDCSHLNGHHRVVGYG